MKEIIELNIRSKRMEFVIYILCFAILLLVGGMMNLFAIATNDGRMPVLSNNYIDTNRHFDYQDESEINEPIMSDRFKLSFFHHNIKYSIGDVFIFISVIGVIIVFLFSLYFEIFTVKKLRKSLNS